MEDDSTFTLSMEPSPDGPALPSVEEIDAAMRKRWGWSIRSEQPGTLHFQVVRSKWWRHVEDMAALSEEFPTIRFSLLCECEDGTSWMVHALAGETALCEEIRVFESHTLWPPSR